jgi:hypothetical protein
VSEGFVRTFLPGVDLGNALDAERHRYLTRRSMERGPSRALRRLFGQRAREQMIATRLPDVLRDLDRILRQEIDSELLDELTVTPREPAAVVRPDPVSTLRPPDVLDEPERPTQATEPEVVPPVLVEPEPVLRAEPVPGTLGQHLASVLHAVLGTEKITLDNLRRLPAAPRTTGAPGPGQDRPLGARLHGCAFQNRSVRDDQPADALPGRHRTNTDDLRRLHRSASTAVDVVTVVPAESFHLMVDGSQRDSAADARTCLPVSGSSRSQIRARPS